MYCNSKYLFMSSFKIDKLRDLIGRLPDSGEVNGERGGKEDGRNKRRVKERLEKGKGSKGEGVNEKKRKGN